MQLSSNPLNKNIEKQLSEMFYGILAELKTPEEIKMVIGDILTESELTSVIKRLGIAGGAVAATPFVLNQKSVQAANICTFRIGTGCTGCGACVGDCPTTAIIPALGGKYRIVSSMCSGCGACVPKCGVKAITYTCAYAFINQSLCTKCGACAGDCPVSAINYSGGMYQVNQECIGCGACVQACPVDAIYL